MTVSPTPEPAPAPNDGGGPDAAKLSPRPRPSSRRWIFRGLAVALAIVPFVAVEAALRLFGVGRNPALVIASPQEPGAFQLNAEFDRAYYGTSDLSGPEPRPFQLPKPAGLRRVLVVGGSTVAGFPFPAELAFPRYIEAFLRAQADPGETIEVLNAGITAINSSTEVDVLREGLAADPDLIVVYTGHNEFYGPGGAASSSGSLSPGWFRALAAARRLRIVQLFRRSPAGPQAGELLEALPGDLHISLESPIFETACRRYRENLQLMARLAAARNVPILFATPISNEHDQPPIEQIDPRGIPPVTVEGERHSFQDFQDVSARGDPSRTRQVLAAFHAANPGNPLVAFRYAQALEQSGDLEKARGMFQEALEQDGCRFRAPRRFREIVLTELAGPDSVSVATLDLYPVLAAIETAQVPGRKSLVEHVHLTWEGNELVGRGIAVKIWQMWKREWQPSKEPTRTELFEQLGTLPEDLLAAFTLSAAVYQRRPFREGADAERLGKRLAQDAVAVYSALPPRRKAIMEQIPTSAMSGDLLGSLITAARSPEDADLRRTYLKAGLRRRPWNREWRSEREGAVEAAK